MPSDRMSCLRIAQMVESDGPGGAETMILELTLELQRRGHVVLPVGPAKGTGWLAAQLRSHGVGLETFSIRRPLDPACYRGLRDLIRRFEVDLVHSHEFTMAVYGAAAARSLRRPHVITFHGGLNMLQRWRRRVALRWAVGASAAAVAVSGPTRRIFSQRIGVAPDRLLVIPNGISEGPGDARRIRQELGLREDEVLVLAVGNVMAVKGHIYLVQALAQLADADVAWRLAIAGDERDAAAPIRALLAERQLQGRVHLLGYRADVADLLAAADVFAMPSLSEGLPMALLEAMFTSRAIVASTVGGIPEVIRDEQEGLLVPPSDPSALAQALRRLIHDPELRSRLGSAAHVRAVEQYSVRTMTDAYESLYRKLVAARPRTERVSSRPLRRS